VQAKTALGAGATLAMLAVAAGAFGSHSLKARLSADMLAVFEVAVRYHMYHALALILTGGALARYGASLFRKAAWFFVLGILLFSGSLYGMSLLGFRWLGILTPVGGVFFLMGWLFLAIGFFRADRAA